MNVPDEQSAVTASPFFTVHFAAASMMQVARGAHAIVQSPAHVNEHVSLAAHVQSPAHAVPPELDDEDEASTSAPEDEASVIAIAPLVPASFSFGGTIVQSCVHAMIALALANQANPRMTIRAYGNRGRVVAWQ